MHGQQHPDSGQLDRLRAGLLDGQPEEKAILERHLAECAICRERSDWQPLHPEALGPRLDSEALQRSLRTARHRGLAAADGRRQRHGFVPYASAALLLIAVSIGVWILQPEHDTGRQMIAQDTAGIPDLYEDLDFYLWLANQEEAGNGDENGNPNNT